MNWRAFGETFVTLFVITDPIGNTPIFLAITRKLPLQRFEADVDPITIPAVLLLVGRPQRPGQVIQHAQIVERVDLAGDR